MSRLGVALIVLVTPLLVAAARDPRGDVASCADGAPVTDPTADLVAVDAFEDELGTAAVWRLRFAAPIPVPDRAGAPLRIDILVRDPKLPAVTVGDEPGVNRIVHWDDTGGGQPIDIVWLPRGGHTAFNPPVVEGRTVEVRVPGRILLGEAGDGTQSVRRTRWSIVVRDGDACDRLGDRPTLRLREPALQTPSDRSSPSPTRAGSDGIGTVTWTVVITAVLLGVLTIVLIGRRASR